MSHLKLLCFGFVFIVFFISNVVAQDTWSQGADMPSARGAHMVTAVNGKIYAVGGNINMVKVEEYDTETNSWVSKADMPTSRTDFSGCSVNGKIYAIGGWNGMALSTVEEYDPETDTWTTKSNMPTTRWGHATCSVNGKVYVIGGATGWPVDEIYGTMEIYNPLTNTWTTTTSSPTPRWFLSCCVEDGKIYAIGGQNDQGTVSTVEVYNPETNKWAGKSFMPTARWGLATAALNGKVYAIGGGDVYPPTEAYRTVEEYDPVSNTWTTKSPMPVGRICLTTCSVNGKIYAPGGGGLTADDAYSELFIYDPGNISGLENDIFKTTNFLLYQNYPNPFNHLTTVSYSLYKSDFVNLKILNITGQEIETLVNTYQPVGDHQITWAAERLPSGIYFCRLQTGKFSETRQLILQK
ncbi:MAG: T9SS type A sorting domain-containing protein [Mariniphaga sp.]|nr:T9SS type A sorting domain-containing protein [Mariniphaga sp.]